MSASTFEVNLDRSLERRERRPEEWISDPHERNALKPMGLPRWLFASMLRRWADEAERYGDGGLPPFRNVYGFRPDTPPEVAAALRIADDEEDPDMEAVFRAVAWTTFETIDSPLGGLPGLLSMRSSVFWLRLLDRVVGERRQPELIDRLQLNVLPSRPPLPVRMALHWFMDGCKVPHWST